MKNYSLLILTFFIHSAFSFCQTSVCADSVKTTYYYHSDNNSTEYSITVDTFYLDSGKVTTCIRSGDSPSTMGNLGCTQGYWSKNILSYNLNNDVTEILIKIGSATGWRDSARTVFTYDAVSGYKLSESRQTWDGSTWVQTYLHSWIYNISNLLIEETDQDFQSGSTNNLNRITWNYTGNVLNSKTVQMGNGNSWVNYKNFIFSYDLNGIRDSVNYEYWDSIGLTWISYGTSPYYFTNLKQADFTITKIVNISGNLYIDSTTFSIDTLENLIYFYELTPTGPQSMGDFYNMTIKNYSYINYKYLITHTYGADYWDDHSGFGLNWYCTGDDSYYYYDAQAYLIKSTQGARCVMPNDFTTEYIYNANHILLKQTGHLDSNTRFNDSEYDYFYGNADSVIVFEDPFDAPYYYLCQGDTVNPNFLASGGCGNYHFSWTPSNGLSSDTIPNPILVVGDSTIYNVTVSDDNGHVATTQYVTNPLILANISIDTSSCSGCPVSISTGYSPYYNYQWYHNDSLMQNADSSIIYPVEGGSYYVVVTDPLNSCSSTSDTIYYFITKTPENINDAFISLHPNPSNGISQLKIGLAKSQHMTINLSGITGKDNSIIYEGNGKDLNLSIDSQKYSPGIYIISITTDKSLRQLRWIVTR